MPRWRQWLHYRGVKTGGWWDSWTHNGGHFQVSQVCEWYSGSPIAFVLGSLLVTSALTSRLVLHSKVMEGKERGFLFAYGHARLLADQKGNLFCSWQYYTEPEFGLAQWAGTLLVFTLLFSYSLFLYNLAKGKRSNPPLQVVCSWIDEINKVAKTKLPCTPAAYTTLVQRVRYLTSKLAKLSGGRQRQNVLSTDWSFQVGTTSVQTVLQ